MTIGAHVDLFRVRWADRFTDQATVRRQTGTSFDPGTGQSTPTYDTIYSGGCLIRPLTTEHGRVADFGQEATEHRRYLVFIPWDEAGAEAGDQVVPSSSEDPLLVGKVLTIRNVDADSYVTRRVLMCEDNQG